MGQYHHAIVVRAPARAVFDYVSDVDNMARYVAHLSAARPAGGDTVHVEADVDGRREVGEGWLHVDAERRSMTWGSQGSGPYRGELRVGDDGGNATVEIVLHTEDVDDPAVDTTLGSTCAAIRQVMEQGSTSDPG